MIKIYEKEKKHNTKNTKKDKNIINEYFKK